MNRKTILLTVLLAFSLSGIALAHGGAEHIKGKVTAIKENSITLTTPTNETKTVSFDKDTKFLKSGSAATVKDLKIDDKVVVDIHKMDGKLHATQVRFGAPKEAAAAHSSHQGNEEKH